MFVENMYLISPEIWITCMACFILLLDVYLNDKYNILSYILTNLTLIIAASLTINLFYLDQSSLFSGSFVFDKTGNILKLFLYAIFLTILIYSRRYISSRNLFKGEYFVLNLLCLLGMMLLVSAGNFLSVYLGLELLTLPLYVLIAMSSRKSNCKEAAMKYFIMSALASGLLLYGISLVYGVTGSLDFSAVNFTLDAGIYKASIYKASLPTMALQFGMVFILAGIAFKFGAVPFHMWIPDVYHGAPTSVTLILATASKIAAFGMAYRILSLAFPGMVEDWQLLLLSMAVLSLAIGNIVAIAQTNLKRMLGYSTISHVGFVLLGLITGPGAGYASAMYYVIIYALMSLGAFGMIILLAKKDFESEEINDFRGLGKRKPWLAFVMLVLMFSLAGVPPTAGFYAKFLIIKSVVDVNLLWVAIVAMLFSVIGAFYYLRIIKVMYFSDPDDNDIPESITKEETNWPTTVLLSANGLLVLGLGIYPAPILYLCAQAF